MKSFFYTSFFTSHIHVYKDNIHFSCVLKDDIYFSYIKMTSRALFTGYVFLLKDVELFYMNGMNDTNHVSCM